jgi:hypothetical protein
MEDKLKNIKTDIQQNTFKDFEFTSCHRQAVFQKLKTRKKADKKKSHFQFRLPRVLSVIAYSGMIVLISSILIHYLDDSSQSTPPRGEVTQTPSDSPITEMEEGILTDLKYENKKYSFRLEVPEEWLNVVGVEELDYGVRFFYKGKDNYSQDLFTINIQEVSERLKFLYEGGPDPSEEVGVLNDQVYRYSRPLDIALSLEEDIAAYGKLFEAVPRVISSFTFTNEGGNLGNTPYIYGFSPQYNEQHGFEVNTPKSWENLFKVESSDTEMKFLFQKGSMEPAEFLSFMYITKEEWDRLQSSSSDEKEYTEITEKDGIIFVASTNKVNPFEDAVQFYPYEMLRTEAKLVIETFQFLN